MAGTYTGGPVQGDGLGLPSAAGIGAAGTTTAGDGPGRPIDSRGGDAERTFTSQGGPQYGGRPLKGDVGPFEGTTSEIGGRGGDLRGGEGSVGTETGGVGGEGAPAVTRPGHANRDTSVGDSSYVA
ncbi:Ubiquitin domain-containing protein ubfd1 [Pleodorina starrii]|uniref:Ubiquitin domain-containing protein ubfd1 n=1 Tax=Pleodorina starrii TaxID=330485 RepID=A0A9W6BSY8_9CHLO|nr:Ubiquitin domain-containing protein ubfd1 [Pleodorina starrii]GLC56946.1 Ubiquitin domain-containing protein ubfd1 [Pleodorina starrii]GLC64781.1 Ubiquitin domain-containing protein ubfd1 [Pleodorina starrii]